MINSILVLYQNTLMECVLSPDIHATKTSNYPRNTAIYKDVLHTVKSLPQTQTWCVEQSDIRIHKRVLGTGHFLNNLCSTGSRYCMLQLKYYGIESRKTRENLQDIVTDM